MLTTQQIQVAADWWGRQINLLNNDRPGRLATVGQVEEFKKKLIYLLHRNHPKDLVSMSRPCTELWIACKHAGIELCRIPISTKMDFHNGGVYLKQWCVVETTLLEDEATQEMCPEVPL